MVFRGRVVSRRAFTVALGIVVLIAVAAIVMPPFLAARHQADLAATRELVQSIVLAAPAVEGCQPSVGERCWTTPLEGRAALEGVVAMLGHAGASDLTERCREPLSQLDVPSCSIQGWYRGDVVMVVADPALLPGPPVHSKGSTIRLLATVS
ncbi:MAG: hypothetical protein ACOH2F_17330 [Cellulomonas sp.]